jgi:SAM-dependent MidA family methyltransferase
MHPLPAMQLMALGQGEGRCFALVQAKIQAERNLASLREEVKLRSVEHAKELEKQQAQVLLAGPGSAGCLSRVAHSR